MVARISIVGAGSIGSRHLQALARLTRPLAVEVADPLVAARAKAAAALAEVGGLKNGQVRFVADVSEFAAVPDVAIVATNARERRCAIEALVEYGTRRLILEKVLFTKVADYDAIESLLTRSAVEAWVNCGRRMFPFADRLNALVDGRPVRYRVEGAGWGLGCNLIHFLDELSVLSGRLDLTYAMAGISGIVPAKREGYIEFVGSLDVVAGDGSSLSAVSRDGTPGARLISIEAGDVQVEMSEARRLITVRHRSAEQTEPYDIPLQSGVTHRLIEAILDDAPPLLPNFSYAARLHRPMIAAFLDRLRKINGNDLIGECPIT